MPSKIGRELVYRGRGLVTINDIPFAYATNAELSVSMEKATLKRSHDKLPDRIVYTGGEIKLNLTLKGSISPLDLTLFYNVENSIGSIFDHEILDVVLDANGKYTHTYNSAVNVHKVIVVDENFYVYEPDTTISTPGTMEIDMGSSFANKKVKLYITYKATGSKIVFNPNTEPIPVKIKVFNKLHPDGQEVLYVPEALISSKPFPRNLEEPFGDMSLEFDVQGGFEIWYV